MTPPVAAPEAHGLTVQEIPRPDTPRFADEPCGDPAAPARVSLRQLAAVLRDGRDDEALRRILPDRAASVPKCAFTSAI